MALLVIDYRSSIGMTSRSDACAWCACILCCASNRGVAPLDEIPFRRFHRCRLKSAVAWVDSEAVLGLVVPSNVYCPRELDFSFRINCQLLARRIHVACPHDRLRRDGSVLRLVIGWFCS